MQSIIGRCWLDNDFLETTLERAILFYALAILIESGCTYTLQLSACKGRLKNIRSIHRAGRRACTYNSVHFVDEKNYVGILFKLVEYGTQTFLKLSAIFCACDDCSHVKRHYTFVKKHTRHFSLHDTLGEPLDNSRFSDTRLAYEHRIILFSSAQNLRYTLNLFLASDNRVKQAIFCSLCHVKAKIVKNGSVVRRTLLLSIRCRLTRAGKSAASARAETILFFIILFGKTKAVAHVGLNLQRLANIGISYVVLLEYCSRIIVFLLQNSEQKMLCIN